MKDTSTSIQNNVASTPPIKAVHQISNKTIIILDDKIVKNLNIDGNTWLQQIETEDGILMRIKKFNVGS